MKIRQATNLEDAKRIARVHVETWKSTYRCIVPEPYLDQLTIAGRTPQWERNIRSRNGRYLFVAEINDEVVGFSAGGREREDHPIYKGEIYAIYVLEAYQKQGIGQQLIQRTVMEFLDTGIESMLIWVLQDNPSRGFYKAIGGAYVMEKDIEIGGTALREIAFGWEDIRQLVTEETG